MILSANWLVTTKLISKKIVRLEKVPSVEPFQHEHINLENFCTKLQITYVTKRNDKILSIKFNFSLFRYFS